MVAIPLTELPSGLIGRIAQLLALPEARQLAGTTPAFLHHVLESSGFARGFKVVPGLARVLAGFHAAPFVTGKPVTVDLLSPACGAQPRGVWVAMVPLDAMAALCSGVTDAADAAQLDGCFILNAVALGRVTCVHAVLAVLKRADSSDSEGDGRVHCLPHGMRSLARIECRALGGALDRALRQVSCRLDRNWLPASSAARVQFLALTRTHRAAVPPGMEALETLDVSGCRLAQDWLPASNAARVQILLAEHSNLRTVPPDMAALQTLNINYCLQLRAEDWLPMSSAARLRVLLANEGSLRVVPACLVALEHLEAHAYDHIFEDDWLHPHIAARLRVLDMSCCGHVRLPAVHMPALERLRILACERTVALAQNWLPMSVAGNLTHLSVACEVMTHFPAGMTALEGLCADCPKLQRLQPDMTALKRVQLREHCNDLQGGWLPPSVAASVQLLSVSSSCLARLPEGMVQLTRLHVEDCKNLVSDWLPLSSAASVMELSVVDSALARLPAGMGQLQRVYLSFASLEAAHLPVGVQSQHRRWDWCGAIE